MQVRRELQDLILERRRIVDYFNDRRGLNDALVFIDIANYI
jgi:ribosomal protein S15P/S13E